VKKQRKTESTPPNFLNAISLPFGRIYHVFQKLLSTTELAKESYHFVHILSPFGNELIKHKLRVVDVMQEIKIRVLHRLYQQIFKATMLNKVLRLAKDES
jgi:hypothetical protein